MDNVQLGLELVGIDSASAPIDKATDSVQEYGDAVEESGRKSEKAADNSKMSWTEFSSMYTTVLAVVQKGQEVWDATVGATVELSNTVRGFRDVTGQTAEESSRLVQVLDDYKIGVSAAEMATKKLANEGLQFNIDTLAKLSDEYLSLNTEQEKTNFLYDKFGKSGDQFAEIMREGGDAIREANSAISENLILTDKALKQARDYEKGIDDLSDSTMALKVSIGTGLLPVANDFLQVMKEQVNEGFEWQDAIAPLAIIENIQKFSEALKDNTTAAQEADSARWAGIASMYETTTATEESTVSIEELSAANEKYLGTIGSVSKEIDSYKEKEEDLKKKHGELLEEKQKLLDQGWWAESEAVQAINEKLAENEDAQAENAAAVDAATKSRMLSMLEQQLAVDGLDARETEFLLQQGLEWGIYSEEAIAAMAAAQAKVDELIAKYNEVPTSITTTFTATTEGVAVTGFSPQIQERRATGGFVTGGESYLVGERGMEMFTPSQSGYITPNNQMSGKDNSAAIVAALYATRLDPATLSRMIVEGVLQDKR